MKTAAQREADFRRDLADLLARHGAELQVTDDGKPYGMHNCIAVVTMFSVYDRANDEVVAEYAEFRI